MRILEADPVFQSKYSNRAIVVVIEQAKARGIGGGGGAGGIGARVEAAFDKLGIGV